jgi:hypothetical protein
MPILSRRVSRLESQDVAQVTHHIKCRPYPQFRARLLRIIAEEQAHVQWLYDQILMRQYESHSPDHEEALIPAAGAYMPFASAAHPGHKAPYTRV